MSNEILGQVNKYYTDKIARHGATHEGVDWNTTESQVLRFNQLLKVTGLEKDCSVLDYGCGYGAMARHMRNEGYSGIYVGFDISDEMIEAAKNEQSDLPGCTFTTSPESLKVDYVISSGIFNVKQQIPDNEWLDYVLDTIEEMTRMSRKGFSFNLLTSYSDADKMRPDLFYGDPTFFVDHCIRNYSRHVAMLHNYGLYEFTILATKDSL